MNKPDQTKNQPTNQKNPLYYGDALEIQSSDKNEKAVDG